MYTVDTFYPITVDISDEFIKKYSKDLQGYRSLPQKLENFAKLDNMYLRHFLEVNEKPNTGQIRMLESHGNSLTERGFLYSDLIDNELVWTPVDDWLKKHDGKYNILYVSSCNLGEIKLEPRISSVVYPVGRFRGDDLAKFYYGNKKRVNLIILEPKR